MVRSGDEERLVTDSETAMIALVVDSGTEVSELAHDALDDAGWRVEVVDDGIAAVGRVRLVRPDVILVGAMPEPGTRALLGALRSVLRGRRIPIVALSEVPADVRLLVDAVLTRPFGRGALLEVMETLGLGATRR